MNIAVILAGGVGSRTGYSVPKQYLTIEDKPVIVYTMLSLQNSGLIDEIYVVCSDAWKDFVCSYAKQYNVHKFISTIPAGESRFETMVNGIDYLVTQKKPEDSVVCIVESVRPIIDYEVLKQNVEKLDDNDCVVTMVPVYDGAFIINPEDNSIVKNIDKSTIAIGQTPVSARLSVIHQAVHYSDEYGGSLPLTVAMMKLNKKILKINGSAKSIKITTAEDFEIVKALLKEEQN